MTPTTAELERAYRANFEGPFTRRTFVHVDATGYDYYYRFGSDGFAPLEHRIGAGDRRWWVVAAGLRATAKVPGLARVLPSVDLTDIEVPVTEGFDTAIVGTRVKTFHLDPGWVYTFPTAQSDDVLEEARVRQGLPESIHVPSVVEVDRGYPYFAEEYLPGKPIRDPIRQRDQVFAALEQLGALYEREFEAWVDSRKFLSEVRTELEATGGVEDGLLEATVEFLESARLPERIGVSQIHGDFHPGNILCFDGDVYLLDWEGSRTAPVAFDFLKLLEVLHSTGRYTALFEDVVEGRGTGWDLAVEYAERCGALAFDSKDFPAGLPVLYLLNRLQWAKTELLDEHRCHRLLRRIVA